MKNFYITTAIDYANGNPHIGHAYEKILADVIARIQRLKGKNVHFLTGLDEHGQKVQKSAQDKNIEPQELCDQMSVKFRELCSTFSVSNDDFIRTTDARHKKVVSDVLQKLFDQGDIYQGEYTGFYSTRQEQFLQEKDKIDGIWPEIFGEVKEITEKNYFFNLKKHQSWLIDFVTKNESFIFPQFRAKQVLEFLKDPINDLCISRPKERLSWGIPLPFNQDYVTYVWFDALLNYVSAVYFDSNDETNFANYWPVDYHVIGKDILVPAHAIYWPIILKALELPMPKTLLVHGWWMSSGNKMSKSLGNTVCPFEIAEKFGSDSFRYFVMREMIIGQDGNFSIELLANRYKGDLANDLGNLVNRFANMTKRYSNDKIPSEIVKEENEIRLKNLWEETREKAFAAFDEFQFSLGIETIFVFIRSINRYTEERAPWKLAKSQEKEDISRLETTLACMAEAIRLSVTLLLPIIPKISEKILSFLGIKTKETYSWTQENLSWSNSLENKQLSEIEILFPRIDL